LYKDESQLTFADGTEENPYEKYALTNFNDDENPVYTEELSENVLTKTEFFYDEDKLLTKKAINYKKTLENAVVYEYNVTESYAYDSEKRLVKTVSYTVGEELTNGKAVEEWVYDEQGNLTKNFTYNTLDSSSKFYKTESAFDQNGKHIAILDQTGEHKTQVEYVDGSSLVKTVKTPDGTKFSYGYDLADNVTAITQSTLDGEENSTQRVYENGLLTKLISGNTVVEYAYTEKRQLASVIVNGATQKTYAYSEDDKTVTVTDVDGNTHTTVKDDFGNVISISKNGTLIESNAYENGLLKTKVKNGVTHTYTYNDKDELVSISYSDGTPTDSFTYVNFGKLVYKIEQGKTTAYTYSADSNKKLVSATVDGIEFIPKTDVNGRVVENQIKVGDTLIEKTATAYLKKGDHATNLPQSIKFWDKTLNGYKDSLSYAYDGKGNISQINQNGKLLAKYTYDGLNRLVREDNAKLNKTYLLEYDRTGNIIAKRTCPFTLEKEQKIFAFETEDIFAYDKDLLVAKNDVVCEYSNGRPTKYMGEDIVFAEKGLVSSFKGVTFAYDNFGKRTAKGDISFTYDKNGRLVSQSNGISFIYDHNGAKIGIAFGGVNYYFRKNMQGDVIALYTQSELVATYVYDAWGNHKIFGANGVEIANNEHIAHLNPIRYRGYYYDTETNLYYLKTRYYDSSVGRFISPDSVDFITADKINGLNLY
ncbi:MAG: RHS repeat-associated core domain-containing protein, partial [Clostridia bacterium]|nr:RHS repeat-associated core domain-containing protein [Clostridia bacterium]